MLEFPDHVRLELLSMMDGFPPKDNCPRRGTQFVPTDSISAQLIISYPVAQFVPIDSGHHATGSGSGLLLRHSTRVWLVVVTTNAVALRFMTMCVSSMEHDG